MSTTAKQTQEALKQIVANAKILTNGSKVLTKSNGSQYILYNVEILDGTAAGQKFTAERVILNSNKEEKSPFEKDQEVVAYINIYPSTVEGRKYTIFVTLGEQSSTANTDDSVAEGLLGDDLM
jgi:hypothetical protein